MIVRVSCFTNIDDFKAVDWPDRMVALPRVGDAVEGRRESMRGARPTLTVVRVTHAQIDGDPVAIVELHR